MDRENRAKQFMPFAALRGYEEALRKRERVVVPKAEMSEEKAEEINRILLQIRPRDMITVVYFREGTYLEATGMVAVLDPDLRILKIAGTEISFDDIFSVRFSNAN